MSTKKPSELEMQRAVRFMRHAENCTKCGPAFNHFCIVALGHLGRWERTWYKEVYRPEEKRKAQS